MLAIAIAGFGNFSIARGDTAINSLGHGSPDVVKIINDGLELERSEEWAEALTHYEDAVRLLPKSIMQTPDAKRLQRRLGVARLHYDLDRRYNDSSFADNLRSLSSPEATTLFAEVLQSIETHHVETPDWNALLRNGTTGLSIALRDDEFRKTNRIGPGYDSVRATIDQIWNTQIRRNFTTRQQAQEFVKWATQVVSQQAGLSPTSTMLEYMCGATSALDTYSTFLTGNQLDEVYSQIEGNFVGLGVELKPDGDSLLIANVIAKGPAERAGILAGDRIVEVDGKLTAEKPIDPPAD